MKQSKILLPEVDNEYKQLNLFAATGHEPIGKLDPFPELLQGEAAFDKVLYSAKNCLGLDFEFAKYNKPSITGISTRKLGAGIYGDKRKLQELVNHCLTHNIKLAGHSAIGAEKRVIEETLEIDFPLDMIEDSMVSHYLLHQDFCKSSGKEDDEGSLGFMNLYVTASMTTDCYQWKICRGRACEGPCPRCKVIDYCIVDAWASVESHYVHMAEMQRMGVPYSLYRELIELSDICNEMEVRGVRIDIPYIDKLDKEMEEAKDKIFEYELIGKTKHYKEFNPRSADQIINWFAARGQNFKTTDIKYLQKVLEKRGQKEEYGDLSEYCEFLEENLDRQDEVTRNLYKLYTFKKSGKGTDAWFAEKYRDGNFIHPRFIVTGTSSGRLASSRPNFTNIPVRGWAVATDSDGNEFHRIKAAIVPRDESLDFLESDASQLELRDVLYLAGVDPKEAGADAFTWLVQQDYEGFKKAASMWPGLDADQFEDVRYVAKSMSHAANYMEGIEIYSPSDLMSGHIKRQIENGAIRLYKDWEYCGGIVGFTGANLAQRFFGARTDENRRKALDIQEDVYFKNFPQIRQWQQRVLAEIEARGYVQSPTGRFLRLYGSPRDNAKIGVAFLGQGVGADHIEAVMLRYKRELNVIPDLMVHDSLLFGIPRKWSDGQARDFIDIMYQPTGIRLDGFACPGKAKRGPNYGSLRKLKI